ncbi:MULTISPECIES: GGDEF domain-containing protein [Marinomonas]|uniref:diguanylate cyclase n=1 Tax=Marinomonas rhodophyticola TaxID=2992803 RepID=A0ABT3KJX2_9GAMM|nr:GGDEF domain-containing protein [Marinomonas sp. KJ51-3]MCW4630451.1 GGDEF domain-containing protein [Marinomonas sp. KJ51-3]
MQSLYDNHNKHLNASSVSPRLFRHLLIIAMVGFSTIWAIDVSSGLISSFDARAYPICLIAFALMYALSIITKLNHQCLHFMTYFIVAGYLTSSSMWHHAAPNGQFSNAAQWLGLNYVIAYLFLEVKKAAPTTIIVFTVTIIGHFAVLIQQQSFSDTLGVVLNIAIAHLIYIFLLWTVIRLRIKTDKAAARADMLENYAYVDLLTRILNRRGLEKVFSELRLDTEEQKQNYAILIIDIDYFKQVNDTYGHVIGDKVLSHIAAKLSRVIHPNDLLGRWGGEEFLVLTLNRTPQQVMTLAENVRAGVSHLIIDDITGITVSIGIAYSNEAHSNHDVFKIADKRLYAAKQAGRNIIRAND